MQAKRRGEREALDRAISAFPVIGRRIGQVAGTLSGGEQQMLAMAAAYTREPRLILVDEASFGLAPLIVEEIFAFLSGLASAGTALLIVDQFINRALDLASRAYLLRRGEIVYSGPAANFVSGDVFGHYLGGDAQGDPPEG